jgi:hypothetical protein
MKKNIFWNEIGGVGDFGGVPADGHGKGRRDALISVRKRL